jgi:hypothetical protein
MINRKLISLFCVFCALNTAFSQEIVEKKWDKGFLLSGCYTRMTGASQVSNNNFNVNSISANDRNWEFRYAPGFAVGVFGKRIISDRFSLQGEFNFLLSRQTAILTETLTPVPAGQFFFQSQVTTNGTMDFSNYYLQIPFSVNVNVDKETAFEAGLFFTQSLINRSTQALEVVTFSTVDSRTGQQKILSPPLVVKNTEQPTMYNGLGWSLGVNYAINQHFTVRVRYEGAMTGVSDFQELRENRMSVGVLFNVK